MSVLPSTSRMSWMPRAATSEQDKSERMEIRGSSADGARGRERQCVRGRGQRGRRGAVAQAIWRWMDGASPLRSSRRAPYLPLAPDATCAGLSALAFICVRRLRCARHVHTTPMGSRVSQREARDKSWGLRSSDNAGPTCSLQVRTVVRLGRLLPPLLSPLPIWPQHSRGTQRSAAVSCPHPAFCTGITENSYGA